MSGIYRDLDISRRQIRLVKLLAGENSQPCADLQVVSLDELPRYEALSYVWGDSKDTKFIQLEKKQFVVTTNLHTALRYLRRRDEDRLLWIDAICINQSNVSERNSQVSLMSQIYQGCTQCVAWLGADSGFMNDVVQLINSMAEGCHLYEWPCFAKSAPPCKDLDALAAIIKVKSRVLKPLEDLIDKQWWNRMWTLQESVLPRKLVFRCGDFEIDWQTFEGTIQGNNGRHIWDCCDDVWYLLSDLDQKVINDYYERVQRIESSRTSGKSALLPLLQRFRARGATDPRDKIFALLGISSQDTLLPVEVRYDLPVIDVYENFAINHIQQHHNLFILCLAGLNAATAGMPSWVPDWSRPMTSKDSEQIVSRVIRYDLYSASGSAKADIARSIHRSLELDAVYIGDVVQYGQVMPNITDIWLSETRFAQVQSVILDWLVMVKIAYAVPEDGGVDEVFLEVFMETLLAGCSYNNDNPGSVKTANFPRLEHDDTEILLMVLQSFMEPARFEENGYSSEILQRVDDFKIGMLRILPGSKLFTTQTRCIGFAPMSVKVGDEAWILRGGQVPFLLRRQNSDELPNFKLVSDCFVHGCMDGELADEVETNAIKIRIL